MTLSEAFFRYQRPLTAAAIRLIGPAEADDAVSRVWCHALRGWGSIREDEGGWLKVVLRRDCASYWRRHREYVPLDDVPEEFWQREAGFDRTAENRSTVEYILGHVKPLHRRRLVAFMQDRPVKANDLYHALEQARRVIQ